MASVLAGFRPVKHMNGSAYNGQVNRYMISASDSQATNVGDFVQLSDNDALVDNAAGFGVYPAVERIGSGTAVPIVGVIVGFEPDYSNLNTPNYRAASTRRVALVADALDIIFAGPQDAVGGVVEVAVGCGLVVKVFVPVLNRPVAHVVLIRGVGPGAGSVPVIGGHVEAVDLGAAVRRQVHCKAPERHHPVQAADVVDVEGRVPRHRAPVRAVRRVLCRRIALSPTHRKLRSCRAQVAVQDLVAAVVGVATAEEADARVGSKRTRVGRDAVTRRGPE